MPSARIVTSTPLARTPRLVQVEGIFDLPPRVRSERAWQVDLPIEERPWNIGLIVGPSGCGKTTIARRLFAGAFERAERRAAWPAAAPVLDGFPAEMPIKEVIRSLTAVGFSSPPSWLRPYAALSHGEQFRADLARLLARAPVLALADDYSATVDRTVARVGSAALARAVRRSGRRFVAVTCHEDVEPWLTPDWVYRPERNDFAWRRLRRRPALRLTIVRCGLEAWTLFRAHHYLSGDISPTARAFLAFWEGRPVAFSAWITAFVKHGGQREHRTVTLPECQGVGIGRALAEFCAALWTGLGQRALSTTSNPWLIESRLRSPHWRLLRAPGLANPPGRAHEHVRHARLRLTAGFEYVGPSLRRRRARQLLLRRPPALTLPAQRKEHDHG